MHESGNKIYQAFPLLLFCSSKKLRVKATEWDRLKNKW